VGVVLDITAADELVLAALPHHGLVTLDGADSLRERSRVGPGALHVDFADGHAYVLEQEPGRGNPRALSVYSMANPDAPVQVGASIPAIGARGLDVANGVLGIFLQDVLRIYDVRDPSLPELQVELSMRSIRDISLEADVAYVLAGGQVHTIPVDGVRPPLVVSSTTVSSQSYSLAAMDGMLAVAGERYGLSLYRLVDPLRPELIETLILGPDRQGWVYAVGLSSGMLFAWDLGGTLHQFDITAGSARLIAGQRLQGYRRHLAVGSSWVAVAGEGIALWPFDALAGGTSTPSPGVSPTMTHRPSTPFPTPDPPTPSPTPEPPTAMPLDGRIWLPIVLRDYRQARAMSTRP
jgi:hypothetical protein